MTILEEIISRPPVYLGNKEFLSEVWRVFSETPVWRLETLEEQLSVKRYGQYPYINGGIRLLRFMGILFGDNNNLRMANNLPGDKRLYEAVACQLIRTLHKTNDFTEVFPAGAIAIDIHTHDICLMRNAMEFKYAPIWNLLRDIVSTGEDDGIERVSLVGTSALLDAFSLTAAEKNRLISQRDLEERLKNQSQVGAEAEKAALRYEKQRLRQMNDLSHVRIISDYNVNAGYDIVSYNSVASKSLDRFIEVKSFVGSRPQFHWSNNEIETAKKCGDSYYIYLVDRFKMDTSNFKPLIIQNPAKNVLESTDWRLLSDGLLCQAVNRATNGGDMAPATSHQKTAFCGGRSL